MIKALRNMFATHKKASEDKLDDLIEAVTTPTCDHFDHMVEQIMNAASVSRLDAVEVMKASFDTFMARGENRSDHL